jgi:hypothetical protein
MVTRVVISGTPCRLIIRTCSKRGVSGSAKYRVESGNPRTNSILNADIAIIIVTEETGLIPWPRLPLDVWLRLVNS